jgi:chemotaxis protein CheC
MGIIAMGIIALERDEADGIAELFNIGMGQAAASLSSMVGEEVLLSVPALSVTTHRLVVSELMAESVGQVCAVGESFSSAGMPFAGQALLIFTEQGGLSLVRRLLMGETADTPGEMERDALTEVGNIILNGCLACLSNIIDGDIGNGVPSYRSGSAEQLIGDEDAPVLFVRIRLALAGSDAEGHVLFLLDITSLETFRSAVRRMLAGAAG